MNIAVVAYRNGWSDWILTALVQGGRLLAALLVFGIIVLVHELGHFLAAKATGVQVNEFAIGFGPTLFRFGKGETKYSVRLIPLGGFCAMEGEDAAGGGEVSAKRSEEAVNNPRSFLRKPVWQRVVITVAGVVMNLLLGFAVLLVQNGVCTLPSPDGNVYYAGTQISELKEDTPSYQSGLRPGDTLLKIDGQRVFSSFDIQFLLQNSDDGVFEMQVRRTVDGKKQTVILPEVTFRREYSEQTGRYTLRYDFYVNAVPQTIGSTIEQAARTECSVAVTVWRTLRGMFTGQYGLNDLSGPVGTVDAIGDVVQDAVQQEHWQDGLGNVLMLVAMLTVNVGIFNLLPLPALDGGRLLFLIWEGITRRPVPPKYEGMVHAIGFALLLLLIIIVTFNDILKIFA